MSDEIEKYEMWGDFPTSSKFNMFLRHIAYMAKNKKLLNPAIANHCVEFSKICKHEERVKELNELFEYMGQSIFHNMDIFTHLGECLARAGDREADLVDEINDLNKDLEDRLNDIHNSDEALQEALTKIYNLEVLNGELENKITELEETIQKVTQYTEEYEYTDHDDEARHIIDDIWRMV